MSLDSDDEILQDFLVEAGEILEALSGQLVELEQRPDDVDLLNAIFRGFHTIKGGAGFLQLNALVDCCHVAENVFDVLRKQERTVTSDLMDTVLNALDSVNAMFDQVRQGQDPEDADPDLLTALEQLTYPEGEAPEAPAATDEAPTETIAPATPDVESGTEKAAGAAAEAGDNGSGEPGEDITDDEFEQLLDALEAGKQGGQSESGTADPGPAADSGESSGDDDEISEEEFEKLLDQLHGEGQFDPAKTLAGEAAASIAEDTADTGTASPAPAATAGDNSDDEITDDEFEALLDKLHGSGKFDGAIADKYDQDTIRQVTEAAEERHAARDSGAAASQAAGSKSGSGDSGQAKAPEPAAAKKEPARKAPPKPAAGQSGGSGKPPGDGGKGPAAPAGGGATPDKAPIQQDTTVRVDTKRLDDIMNMVGELVLVRNRLVRLSEANGDLEIGKAVSNLDVVTTDLQNSVMKTRMQPIKKVFGRFPRVVRDLARNLKKEINLELVGEDTDLDKNLVEALADPLVHLVRNSVDHGIEQPDEREKKGKPRTGKVVLSAEQEGDHIMLSISDDGGGMDAGKLKQLAVDRGVLDSDSADRLTDKEAFNLIFAPGFSTKTEISDVSGRGVGMDVVKTKISQLNGFIDIDSRIGHGTTISIKVPLTLAIMPTLMVTLGEQAFALPLVNVDEIFHLDLTKTNVVDNKEVVVVRGKPLPLFYLKRWLIQGAVTHGEESGHVVVVSVGTQKVGFVVDQLVGQEEVVIKPLGKTLIGTAGMAGATITGDGRIALILDVPSMLKEYA